MSSAAFVHANDPPLSSNGALGLDLGGIFKCHFRVATAIADQSSAKFIAVSHDDGAHRPSAFLRRFRSR